MWGILSFRRIPVVHWWKGMQLRYCEGTCASFLSKRLQQSWEKTAVVLVPKGDCWVWLHTDVQNLQGCQSWHWGWAQPRVQIQVKSGASSSGRQPWLLCVIDSLQNSQWPCTGKQSLLLELDMVHGCVFSCSSTLGWLREGFCTCVLEQLPHIYISTISRKAGGKLHWNWNFFFLSADCYQFTLICVIPGTLIGRLRLTGVGTSRIRP